MAPRFPNPRDVRNAVQRRETLQQRWEKDALLLLAVFDAMRKYGTDECKLTKLSKTIRTDPHTRQLVPSTGLSRWLKKPQWHPFIRLIYEPVEVKASGEGDVSEETKQPPPLCIVQWTGKVPDVAFLDRIEQGAMDPCEEEYSAVNPEVQLYAPDVHVTPEEARTMALVPPLDAAISDSIHALNEKLAISTERKKKNQKRRAQLEQILGRTSLTNVQLHLFGSSANGLNSETSDLDLCITSDEIDVLLKEYAGKRTRSKGKSKDGKKDPLVDIIYRVANMLKRHNMRNVVAIPWARVPVIKFEHPLDGQPMDIAIANWVALRNTKLFYTYTQIDSRVRPLLKTIKYWASRRVISDAAQNGNTINSYTHVLLMLHYLQRERVIPPLQRLCCGEYPSSEAWQQAIDAPYSNTAMRNCIICKQRLPTHIVDGYETYFYDRPIFTPSPNKASIATLLAGFLRYYAFEFDYARLCVSVRWGAAVWRDETAWPIFDRASPNKGQALCVEDPFVLERNTAVSAQSWTIDGIRWEYERALRALLSGRGLDGMCVPWQPWAIVDYADVHLFPDA
ncbi:hypothetical protein SYNPS1DRAFT_26756 [Syncephalis pseudoplumigaleata]|uniref:polynucleotide adenylyltransferase n=1 Tax=Syncephalis pseudoplumigaleata TaxID=1712513 RepID=A0A4P9Z651_9FUNG|nr:hypothetical protein SYNPS1DRAFT_26756 [Syncephalis pseudoplumigaleata]|eukprot:RKP27602.1 hypothetical protein SYNPS1DRAFT_26756 [Syncephalis pseudoplumigaleata]